MHYQRGIRGEIFVDYAINPAISEQQEIRQVLLRQKQWYATIIMFIMDIWDTSLGEWKGIWKST